MAFSCFRDWLEFQYKISEKRSLVCEKLNAEPNTEYYIVCILNSLATDRTVIDGTHLSNIGYQYAALLLVLFPILHSTIDSYLVMNGNLSQLSLHSCIFLREVCSAWFVALCLSSPLYSLLGFLYLRSAALAGDS